MFAVTALAIAAERANAVGVVRLTCLPEGLEIELVRAAGFSEGFAPSSVAQHVSFTVPYTAVRGLVRHGRTLALALDPAVATPHNRFALVRFTDDPAEALAQTYRARLIARWVSYLLPAPLGLAAVLAAPSGLVSGALGTASLGVLAALLAWVALRGLVRWLTWGGPVSDQYRDAFETELSRRLGLLPAKPIVTPPWDALPSGAVDPLAAPSGRRLAVIGIIVAASAGLVGVMAFLKRFAGEKRSEEDRPLAAAVATGAGTSARALADIKVPAPGSDRPRCFCERADSPLWKDGVPLLSVLLSQSPDDGSGAVTPAIRRGGRRPRYDFDLAVVNNAAAPVRDVRVVLTFARRDERGERAGVTDRGLFWGSVLAPGRAVKWRVRAPGTEMKIEPEIVGTLEKSGSAPAPPDAYFELMSSRYRVVRIHAAMMLAYLRDPRAREAVRSLSTASPVEAPTLARIERAAAPVIACDIKAQGGTLEACVFNAESKPAEGLTLREVSDGGDDSGAPLRSFPIEGAIPVHEGARVSFPLEGDAPLELVAERAPKQKPPP
jgi:hypothetical protein